MAQFGVGPDLVAQCPAAPKPDGWRTWVDTDDGPVPDGLSKRAAALAADTSVPLGTTESYPLPGVTALVLVEPRIWGRDAQGNLVQGCFRVGGIYLPTGESVTSPKETGWNKAVTVLTVGSLVVGIGATLWGWGSS